MFSVLVVFYRWIFGSIEIGAEGREEVDLESVISLVFMLENNQGGLPTNEEMSDRLNEIGKDQYGNPYMVKIHSSNELVVIVATATGKDGRLGGFGENRDRTKVVTRP